MIAMRRPHVDDPNACAACGAVGIPLRLPTIAAPERPGMRVCVDDRECYDRWHARKYPSAS